MLYLVGVENSKQFISVCVYRKCLNKIVATLLGEYHITTYHITWIICA